MSKSAIWTVAILLAAGPSFAQDLGVVSNAVSGPEYCRDEPLLLEAPTTCHELTVSCPGTDDRVVNLRVTEPPEGTAIRGTVVMGLGGGGVGWYERGGPTSKALIDDLNVDGFRVIQRAWSGDVDSPETSGWFRGASGLHSAACRYSTLVEWIYTQPDLHDPSTQALCATGNSGGSTEIAYALSVYGMGDRLDLAVPTGGPPHGLTQFGCGIRARQWRQRCNAMLDRVGICPQRPGQHLCFYNEDQVAGALDGAFDLLGETPCADRDFETLRDESALYPGAILDYPQTAVQFLIGENDCGSAPPLGMPFIAAVNRGSTGPTGFAIVPDTPHRVSGSPNGAAAIRAAIGNGCVPRH